jgi:uncharacterized membrane protein YesL
VSEAEEAPADRRVPDAPRIGGTLRAAAVDFYFNSWRLVPLNALWGAGLLATIIAGGISPAAYLAGAVLLAFPTVALFRVAALIVRGGPVALSDGPAAWRLFPLETLGAGIVITGLGLVFGANLLLGLVSVTLFGYVLATVAFWSLVVLASAVLVYWPLLVDPARGGRPLRYRLRLTALLVLASPLRFAVLALVLGVLVAISTVLFAALLTITIAYTALVATRYTLPVADRFEGRATQLVAL